MKILSIRSPWWWWILHGGKDIENRSWRYAPAYSGEVAIHASKWWNANDAHEDYQDAKEMWRRAGSTPDLPSVTLRDIREGNGHIVGRVYMRDAVWTSDSPWFVGPLGFVFGAPEVLATPIPFKARLGLFDAPPEICQAFSKRDRYTTSVAHLATTAHQATPPLDTTQASAVATGISPPTNTNDGEGQ